ncbi:transmembrane protein 216 [Meleagris gallopavo]|uniref:transmembrane protein 216 n=1 Tax=Meleagris gallopavo TaxID=9103 RepID=UPI000549C589|nr:transmembrane protein 216 [Meleagris gallopavo]
MGGERVSVGPEREAAGRGRNVSRAADRRGLRPSHPTTPTGRQLSSAPLQVLLFLNGWYSATYFLLEAFIFAYKVLLLPYPLTNLLLDVLLLLLYLGIETTRIFFGSKGNLCQHKMSLAVCLALTVPAAVMATYCLLLQTYALRLEAILSTILLLFYTVELLLGGLALTSFSSMDVY